jgi:sirohydrochlorin ferrochelatase/(2Fe-2S) ferredoxin
MKTVVLIVGHGSRDPLATRAFETVVSQYQERRREFSVRFAYVELAAPALPRALSDAGKTAEQVVVFPLFLFSAGHVKNDIPLALATARRAFPSVRFAAARALGVHPTLAELALERAESSGALTEEAAQQTALVLVARGTSDPDANGDFYKMARLIAERKNFSMVAPCFSGVRKPLFSETLELAARSRPQRLLIVPYLLFTGRISGKLQEQVAEFSQSYPWIKTELAPPLGADPKLFSVIDERIAEAMNGTAPLPCDTCQYRVPLAGLTENVGGLKALLWSIRHSFTHSSAAPHRHAHKPIKKHVLVCGNADCADRGSIPLIDALRRLVKDAGRERDIRVTRTSCMGRCGEGPTLAVYPDGIWYRGVGAQDAPELVREHLLSDRLVARLVDNIMQ